MNGSRSAPARHRSTDPEGAPLHPGEPPREPGNIQLIVILNWVGRALLVFTAVVVTVAYLTRDDWVTSGVDENGSPASGLINFALVLALAVGIGSPYLCGVTTSPEGCWRDGDHIVALTVIGRRRILVPGARTVPFRVPTQTGTAHGMLVLDRWWRLLVMLNGFAVNGPTRMNRLIGRTPVLSLGRLIGHYAIGVVLFLVVLVATFACLGLVAWITHAFDGR